LIELKSEVGWSKSWKLEVLSKQIVEDLNKFDEEVGEERRARKGHIERRGDQMMAETVRGRGEVVAERRKGEV